MTISEGLTQCPYCFGEIQTQAKKCRHCGEWISTDGLKATNTIIKEQKKPESQNLEFPIFATLFAWFVIIINIIYGLWLVLTLPSRWSDLESLEQLIEIAKLALSGGFVLSLVNAPKKKIVWPYGFTTFIACGYTLTVFTWFALSDEKGPLETATVIGSILILIASIVALVKVKQYCRQVGFIMVDEKTTSREEPTEIAAKLLQRGHLQEALSMYEEITRKNPDNLSAWIALSNSNDVDPDTQANARKQIDRIKSRKSSLV